MSDKFEFDEELYPVPPSALDADPAAAMQDLLYRVSKLEQTLDEERLQAVADTRDLLLQVVSLSDDITRIVERWGVTTNAKEAVVMQSIVALGKKALAVLDHYGTKPIETMGKALNPRTSEVVGSEVRDKMKPDIVLREAQIGYTWKHGLLRKARVIVSSTGADKPAPAAQPPAPAEPGDKPYNQQLPNMPDASRSEDKPKGGNSR